MASAPFQSSDFGIDPSLQRFSRGDAAVPIDPALFELEGLVNDVRRGKVRLDEQQQHEEENDIADEHDIDPALREIVNSLTNAQQSTNAVGSSMTAAQAAAAISAHIADHEDGERLQQSIEDITSANYGLLLPSTYPTSPGSFDIHQTEEQEQAEVNGESSTSAVKRGRGRPKGSRNKQKAPPKPKTPKPPKTPSRPRGRPPRDRTAEEQAIFEAKKLDRASGIKRKKGRPRKFPGYLIREMRLRKNRSEYLELVRRAEEGLPIDGIRLGSEMMEEGSEGPGERGDHDEEMLMNQGNEDVDMGQIQQGVEHHQNGTEEDDIVYPWPTDDQALLDVVGAAAQDLGVDVGVDMGRDHSEMGRAEDAIREVWNLESIR